MSLLFSVLKIRPARPAFSWGDIGTYIVYLHFFRCLKMLDGEKSLQDCEFVTLPLTSAIWQPDIYFDNSIIEWSLGKLEFPTKSTQKSWEPVYLYPKFNKHYGVTGIKENHPMSVNKPLRFCWFYLEILEICVGSILNVKVDKCYKNCYCSLPVSKIITPPTWPSWAASHEIWGENFRIQNNGSPNGGNGLDSLKWHDRKSQQLLISSNFTGCLVNTQSFLYWVSPRHFG